MILTSLFIYFLTGKCTGHVDSESFITSMLTDIYSYLSSSVILVITCEVLVFVIIWSFFVCISTVITLFIDMIVLF